MEPENGKPQLSVETISPADHQLFDQLKAENERTRILLELYEKARYLSDRQLYDYVLEKAVELTGSQIGFFHLVNEDQLTLKLTTWTQESQKRCTAVYVDHYPIDKAGNWVDCIRQKRPVVYNDFPNSPNQKGLPAGHVPLRRFMSIPVVENGRVHFIFGVGNKGSDYNDHDIQRLQLVANELFKIVAQKRLEQEVKSSEDRYRILYETMTLGVVHQNQSGQIVAVNPAACRILGRSQTELLSRRSDDTMWQAIDLYQQPIPAEQHPAMESLRTGDKVENRIMGILHPGLKDHVWINVSAIPIKSQTDDGIAGVYTLFEDISQKLQLENQLRQSQKMEAVGQLAGGIAHDFNNILQAILGYSEMVGSCPGIDELSRTYTDEIIKGAKKAAMLTRQLLTFSRRQVMKMEDLDLNEVITSITNMIRRLIGESVELTLSPGKTPLVIHGDRGHLEQILINLCINARDAMPDGGHLVIETSRVNLDDDYCQFHTWAHPGSYVLLSITDTGIGMNEETLRHIFEPFFTTKELGKGTGLGLATVFGIVSQHKGLIHVYSEPGQGSCFKIYLPWTSGAPVPQMDLPSGPPPTGDETILVAEDDGSIRQLIKMVLEGAGYRVLLATNGAEALEIFEEAGGEVALLLLDVVMPVMGGRAVFNSLQNRVPKPKFLFASGYSINAIHKGFVLEPGIELIEKPYSPGELLRRIRRILDL